MTERNRIGMSRFRRQAGLTLVELVVTVGRTATGARDAKIREIVRTDLSSYAEIEDELTGFDACFFCLGISSAGMTEQQYTRITYDITLAAARTPASTSSGILQRRPGTLSSSACINRSAALVERVRIFFKTLCICGWDRPQRRASPRSVSCPARTRCRATSISS